MSLAPLRSSCFHITTLSVSHLKEVAVILHDHGIFLSLTISEKCFTVDFFQVGIQIEVYKMHWVLPSLKISFTIK